MSILKKQVSTATGALILILAAVIAVGVISIF